jgi:hypothetical protein
LPDLLRMAGGIAVVWALSFALTWMVVVAMGEGAVQ